MSEVRLEHAPDGPVITNGTVTVTVRENSGTFTVVSEGRASVIDAAATVITPDGRAFSTRSAGFTVDGTRTVRDGRGDGLQLSLRREADETGLETLLRIAVYRDQPFVILQTEACNRGQTPVRIQTFHVIDGGRLDLGTPATGWRVYKEGWQNWSASIVLPVSGEDIYMAPPVVGPATQPPRQPGRFLSEMMTAVVDPATGRGLVAGFVSTADQFSQVWLDRGGPSLSAASYADGIALLPGERLSSERLLIEPTQTPLESMKRYGDVLGREMGAVPWPQPVSGWCSWYYYWQGITEDNILENLEFLAAHRRELPLDYFQIDDGYQAGIGDWLETNEKFPHGMGWIAEQVHNRGFKAGLWLAPFMMGEHSRLWSEHPDWAVQYKPGKPYLAMINWAQRCYGMDLTHPEAIGWLETVFRTVFNEWKYDYVKIDFLYAAAVDGIRRDPQVTRAQAYRRGIEVVRKIAGDRFILGCGHPLGPSIGIVNGSRIGSDVAPFWFPAEPPREPGRNDLTLVSTYNAMRNVMDRFWMHERLWLNDPDVVMARDSDTALTLDEITALTTAIALSGGMTLDSDNLNRLGAHRREVLSMLLPVYGKSAEPLDLFSAEGEAPQVFVLDCGTHQMFGLFNWAGEEAPVDAPLPDGPSHVFDVWRRTYLGVMSGPVRFSVPRHGCRLLAVRPATGRPQTVGSAFHVLQGAMEIAGETWDGHVLRLDLRPVARTDGELFVHVPDVHGAPSAPDVATAGPVNGVWALRLEIGEPRSLTLRFASP